MRIYVAGIGPGSSEDITPALLNAVADSNVVVGYKYYFQFIEKYISKDTICIDTGMKKERQRAEMAFEYAEKGNTVCVISSGDAGIYGMAPLIYEMKRDRGSDVEIISIPGISAFQKAASLLGAPMGHDFCVISMSDLMTPWQLIEKRIKAAAEADFITAVYNPKSNGRYWQLYRLKELFLKYRSEDNVVGFVRQAGRDEQNITITTLKEFNPEDVDMFTVVIIGNSQSYQWNNAFITPRGYYRNDNDNEDCKVGQSIMIKSFRTIRNELKNRDIPTWKLWPMLHAIHTTADFDMENLLWMDDNATADIYNKVKDGQLKTIVTDVSMVAAGIRKGALERLGIKTVCYINDPRAIEMAKDKNITRAQAGMRLAAEEYPDALYAFGNAPTALLELCSLVRKKQCSPAGIIGAPVGFVHVEESKHAAKSLVNIPKIIIDGRKGGSNLAATLVNSILTFDDAELLRPGRDV
ncbi:precorrin-3B C(17)-methyltransferase [uncultured Prevotella sp.]|uniref:precorrin-3B C(17)-methyltransferase n=1 Tax=uncultured Prevotella sp. TaxID=159272 RepID=UPI0028052944|nr:precorrin-3B C(17)-methyltransferase [uncultured Prevotella sp.]